MEFSELDLVENAKKGDANAFSEIYDIYYPKIFGYIARRVSNVQIAADITSETFLKVLKKINTFVFQDIPFSAWIYRIATNEIANYYRQKSTYSLEKMQEQFGFEIEDKTNIEEELEKAQFELERNEMFVAVSKKLKNLPIHYHEVIVLRFFEKKKLREISDILGKSEGTIKSLLSRGIEKLRKEMEVEK